MRSTLILLIAFIFIQPTVTGQDKDSLINEQLVTGMKMRNIGPAMTSGRIADIAIHPDNQNVMFVAAGSGNLWKTENAGTTWTPVFENYGSYSLGCITFDPANPHIVWLGTGENVGGRHVGIGDGIYKSVDGGKTWKNVGLKSSEHISRIVVHPSNSDVVWVAAQGPLWSPGGERGIYMTTDGGKTWEHTLGDDQWVGATDIVIDPRDPDRLYAATWQRHRTVAAYMGGGPGTALYRSIDGGKTWEKLTSGLPQGNLGKIGLAISPFNPDRIYAAIETIRTKGGLYMSSDRGSSWTKQSDMVSGGTGPHYYQELYADPHHEGRLYLMNNIVLISDDHGKTYRSMNEDKKHVDTHAMAFRKSDPDYVVMGTDGGIYESFDQTKTWRFVRNLPLVQYYKVAVDDAEPFYNVYGGTQDNGSHGGPSRTNKSSGIHNDDWRVVLGADGHQSATEPGNPNITYGEFQQGWLFRIDHTTGESTFIQPQAGEGDPNERFNWDAPILVSPHDPKRLYFASYRVWRSNNRGDDWTAVSGDLTRNEERLALPIMGKEQSWDNAWDVGAMSNYNTITSLAESPLQEGLLYAGTDDGIIQVSEDGGAQWRKLEVQSIKGIPERAFVNDIRADLFDANIVYCALDNHKAGDYKPYLVRSRDKGRTWESMTGNLPDKLLVWRIVQDHVKPDLFFLATEYGLYFTIDSGKRWVKLKGGTPTISFRDVTIQRRENDVVGASFGRGFYVLDDYSALRDIHTEMLDQEAVLFDTRKAHWYAPIDELYGQGHAEYAAENPPYGATFTYYLKDQLKSLQDLRKGREKELSKKDNAIPFPGWESLEAETRQESPAIYLTIRDANGDLVKQIKGKNAKGIQRVSWDLSLASKDIVRLEAPRGSGNWFGGGIKAVPGTYTVTLSKLVDGAWTDLAGPKSFEVVPLKEPSIKGATHDEIVAFQQRFDQFRQQLSTLNMSLSKGMQRVDAMMRALSNADRPEAGLVKAIYDANTGLQSIDIEVNGLKSKGEVGERDNPAPGDGMFIGFMALNGTYGPTGTHKKALERSEKHLATVLARLKPIVEEVIPSLEDRLSAAGAPPIEGSSGRN